ncbi:MAG: LEA type 2 family protein [Chitinophagaceae bacterium]|nr:LEA type 2 family protein [Chitinophagaceae bacterium]
MKFLTFTLPAAILLLASCKSTNNVKEPEYVDIRDVRLVKAGVLKTTAGIDLIYYNPNNFGIQLTNARGDVYIDNKYFGRFELDEKVQVRKNSEFVLPVMFTLDNLSAVANQHDIYKKKEALVRIEGTARVKKSGFSKDVPVKFERLQNIEKLKKLISK